MLNLCVYQDRVTGAGVKPKHLGEHSVTREHDPVAKNQPTGVEAMQPGVVQEALPEEADNTSTREPRSVSLFDPVKDALRK